MQRCTGRIDSQTYSRMSAQYELTFPEIKDIVEEASCSDPPPTKGDFDGVELNGSAGYPPEQFLSSGTNRSIPSPARHAEVLGVMIAKLDRARGRSFLPNGLGEGIRSCGWREESLPAGLAIAR